MPVRRATVAALVATAAAVPVLRNTTYGVVQGDSENGISSFRSIPFAQPPVGQLRFRAPVPPNPWSGVKDVTAAATPCAQLKLDGDIFIGSEDCLQLSVFVPENAVMPMPVMVWIYGGAYVLGDSNEFGLYDPTNLVTKSGYILVAGNYRLGPFGFNALTALRAEDPNNSTGNAALQDQTAVLQWVHDNIAYFGGDPNRVTIFGESAGGFSVCWHMVSEASAGLFSAAIMESGSCDSPQFFQTLDDAIEFNTIYATAVGCNATSLGTGAALLACLRSKSTNDIMKSLLDMLNPNWPFTSATEAYGSTNITDHLIRRVGMPPLTTVNGLPALAPIMPWGPAIDGTSVGLKDVPLNLLQAGKFNKVPFMLGTNVNEGSIFIPALPLVVPDTEFPPRDSDFPLIIEHALDMYNSSIVNSLVSTIMSYYPPYPLNDNWARGTDILTHMFFACSARRSARAASAAGVPTFLYQFSHKLSWIEYVLLGDYHMSELFFVWRNQWPIVLHTFDSNDWTMADSISSFWFNFAGSGNPNNGPFSVGMNWPEYSRAQDTNMQLQVPLNVTQSLLSSVCNMWDSVSNSLNDPASRRTESRWKSIRSRYM